MNAKKLLEKYIEQRLPPFNRQPKYARMTAIARTAKTSEEHIEHLRKYNNYWKRR